MFNSNTWNYLIVCKRMISIKFDRNFLINRMTYVRYQYLKPFNCVQTNEYRLV